MRNKAILITGVLGNIGQSAAKIFKREGWMIVGMDNRNLSDEEMMAIDYYIHCDVTDRRAVVKAVKDVEQHITLGAVFTAAGTFLKSTFLETSIDDWSDTLKVWLGGTTNVCSAVAPHFVQRREGKIIILSPDYNRVAGDCILNATAAGTLHGFAKSLGMELAQDGVTVNALWAGVPFSAEEVSATAFYLANQAEYITAQVISIAGRE